MICVVEDSWVVPVQFLDMSVGQYITSDVEIPLVVAVEQKNRSVLILCPNGKREGLVICASQGDLQEDTAGDTRDSTLCAPKDKNGDNQEASENVMPSVIWRWIPDSDTAIAPQHRRWFDFLNEVKVTSDSKGIIVTASGGSVARVGLETCSVEWYCFVGGNPHSVCELPWGDVAYVASDGSTVGLLSPDPTGLTMKLITSIPLYDAHGIWYDRGSKQLIALGAHEVLHIRCTQLSPQAKAKEKAKEKTNIASTTIADEPPTQRQVVAPLLQSEAIEPNYPDPTGIMDVIARILLPRRSSGHEESDHGGHDLSPCDADGSQFFVTDLRDVWVYSPSQRTFDEFSPLRGVEDVKSISKDSTSGAIIYVQAQEEWWTDTIHHVQNQAQWRSPGARFYKARWLSPQAAHIGRCAPIPQGKDTNDSSN